MPDQVRATLTFNLNNKCAYIIIRTFHINIKITIPDNLITFYSLARFERTLLTLNGKVLFIGNNESSFDE